jgi:hypothetical protein
VKPAAIDPRAIRAWPAALRGIAFAVPGTVIVGLGGEVLRVREDGTIGEVLPGGHPHGGAASDPCNTRAG